MPEIFYLSERSPEFKLQQSLLEAPFNFDTFLVKRSVFYRGLDGGLGGDTFSIRSDDSLVISLLGDVEGEGARGRECIMPLVDDLDNLIIEEKHNKKENLTKKLIDLENKTGPGNAITLSYANLTSGGQMYCISIGENILMIKNNHRIHLCTRRGKIGYLKYSEHDEKSLHIALTPDEKFLSGQTSILMCTDGVVDYTKNRQDRVSQIRNTFLHAESPEECIRLLNKQAYSYLTSRLKRNKPLDDYTVMALELKNP